ncbi:MAG: signal recognition particle protein [Dehalococcoidia bacterium]|nr:signal recognition particle protein [Dehalococcoidia bacterium]
MFETLTERLTEVFRKLGAKGKLSDNDIDEALRQVRLALLEADVNFKVVKSFTDRIRDRARGAEVLESLTPAQQVIKLVNEELISTLGQTPSRLTPSPVPPSPVMLVGLQGCGKTTTAAKLALQLRQSGHSSLLVAADVHRPAAVQQLVTLGQQLQVPVFAGQMGSTAPEICRDAVNRARELAVSWLIVDTAGRLHVDEDMMIEMVQIKDTLKPAEVILVVDAMTGQDAVRVAEEFHARVGLTGLILTKLDGDARGGAALSIRAVTGVPVKFIGLGEKLDALEVFYPERLASRILGMGDMLTLIEKAEKSFDVKRVQEMEKKLSSARFDLEDFLEQIKAVKKMGSLSQLAEMLPGFSKVAGRLTPDMQDKQEKQLKKMEAIINSMTPEERRHPDIIGGSRKKRIARGSGTTPQDINQFLNQFFQMQKLLKQFNAKKGGKPFPFFR